MKRVKSIVVGLSLTVTSLLILLLGLEVILRITIENQSDLTADLTYSRTRDAEYYQRSFLELYPGGKDWRRGVYDPDLGWDQPNDERIVGIKTYALQADEDLYRIAAIGDSFVFGSFVNTDQTYPAYLESLVEGSEVLNMGVVGYGIDQAVLKYLEFGVQYKPDLVILGTFPHDYVRTGLSFYGYSKPVFVFNDVNNSVELTNTDIPPPQEVYDDLREKLDVPILYSRAFLENRLTRAYWRFVDSGARDQYYEEMDIILEHILTKLIESTRATTTKLLIVEVPHGTGFRNEKAWLDAKKGDVHVRLLNLYEKLGIPYVDLLEEFMVDNSMEEVFNDLYIRVSEGMTGHFTPEGNLEVARIIENRLEDLQWGVQSGGLVNGN
ncbi:MAG: SGNH/GDSL hydrolase family protein [Dehalococcoidia bacterium]|jgi:hypothetical protein|nr:SGNH/GDSL hydrolase family protein [Dehalococcoidia bacterium]